MNPNLQTTLTTKQQIAARLVAEDKLTDVAIAAEVGIGKRTLETWKHLPGFRTLVTEITREYLAISRQRGIAVLERRLDRLNGDWLRMQAVITARAKRYQEKRHGQGSDDFDTAMVPEEAETGLLVLMETPTKAGMRREWQVDTGLLAELRNHEQQAAKELGQWVEKADIEVRDTTALTAVKRKLLSRSGTGGDTGTSLQSE